MQANILNSEAQRYKEIEVLKNKINDIKGANALVISLYES